MLNTLITIIVTVLIFGFLIGMHELGHYIAARLFGVGIIEFSIGMGPKVYHRDGKVNDFSVRALPIGGYVSMVGEYSDEIEERHKGKRSLADFPAWKRLVIGLAGPVMNILLAFVIMALYVLTSPVLPDTLVTGKYEDGDFKNTSFECGLQEGDRIIKVGNHKVNVYLDLSYEITSHGNQPIDITVLRNGEKVVLKDVKFPTEKVGNIEYGSVDFTINVREKTFGTILHEAFFQPVAIVYTTVDSIIDTFSGRYDVSDAVGGPVAIGGAIGETLENSKGFLDALRSVTILLVFISVSLGICNLLPIPVLDGGMILFCLIEIIFRKPVPKKIQDSLQSLFAILLLGLMFIICIKDVIGLF